MGCVQQITLYKEKTELSDTDDGLFVCGCEIKMWKIDLCRIVSN